MLAEMKARRDEGELPHLAGVIPRQSVSVNAVQPQVVTATDKSRVDC
jgi:hypothetical protein